MKKILSLALILFASIAALAQERTLQKEEFDKVQIDGLTKYNGKAYRRRESSQFSAGDPSVRIMARIITETSSSKNTRMVYESNSPYVNIKRENIMVAGITYTRENDGKWEVKKDENNPRPPSSLTTLETQTDYKFLGNENLENDNTTVYQKIEKKKTVNPTTKLEMLSTISTKSWFGEDGGILKQEVDMEIRSKNPTIQNSVERISRNVRTTIWELDPNIKIEAPAVN